MYVLKTIKWRGESLNLVAARYVTGNLALRLELLDDQPFTTVTVNLDIAPPYPYIAVKNYSENEGILEVLIDNDIIEVDPVVQIKSGFVSIPVHKLTQPIQTIIEQTLPEQEMRELLNQEDVQS